MKNELILQEKHNLETKNSQGRATTLYPRTLEMLDQIDLLDEMNQIGFIGRNSVTYVAECPIRSQMTVRRSPILTKSQIQKRQASAGSWLAAHLQASR